MTRPSSSEVWKWLAASLFSVVMLLSGAVYGGSDKPTKTEVKEIAKTACDTRTTPREVREIVQNDSPFLKAAGSLEKGIATNEKAIVKLDGKVEGIQEDMNGMKAQQRIDTQRIVNEIRKRPR